VYRDQKVVVVMPACDAAQTPKRTGGEVGAQQIAEGSCPTSPAGDASSVNFPRSVRYGFGGLATGPACRPARMGRLSSPLFPPRTSAADPGRR